MPSPEHPGKQLGRASNWLQATYQFLPNRRQTALHAPTKRAETLALPVGAPLSPTTQDTVQAVALTWMVGGAQCPRGRA